MVPLSLGERAGVRAELISNRILTAEGKRVHTLQESVPPDPEDRRRPHATSHKKLGGCGFLSALPASASSQGLD